MARIRRIGVLVLMFILGLSLFSYCKPVEIAELVDNFQSGTGLQKDQLVKDNLGKEISASGIVSDAGEYDYFDTANDLKGTYYQVITEQQKTKNNIPYQVIFLFKDKDTVKDIDKGENIQKEGKIIRIMDERLQIAVWIFCGELTEKDKALFKL